MKIYYMCACCLVSDSIIRPCPLCGDNNPMEEIDSDKLAQRYNQLLAIACEHREGPRLVKQ